jgi:hypothetical protein
VVAVEGVTQRIKEKIMPHPGFAAVAALTIELGKEPIVFINHMSRDYFQTMGMQVRAGRPFSAKDSPKAQLAAIINERQECLCGGFGSV